MKSGKRLYCGTYIQKYFPKRSQRIYHDPFEIVRGRNLTHALSRVELFPKIFDNRDLFTILRFEINHFN